MSRKIPACECGCGKSVAIFREKPRRFCSGHHQKGRKHSSETKAKIALAHIGMTYSQETKDKISAAKSGEKNSGWKGIKKVDSFNGYVEIWVPNHPKARNGRVAEHRLVMEHILGRYLHTNELVHHINENRQDNRKENLRLVTKSEHTKYHNSTMSQETKDKIRNTVKRRWNEGVYNSSKIIIKKSKATKKSWEDGVYAKTNFHS